MALPFSQPITCSSAFSIVSLRKSVGLCNASLQNQTVLPQPDSWKLVLEVKDKLEKQHPDLPIGKNGRDDDDMILQFLKDRRFHVEDTVGKLIKAIVSTTHRNNSVGSQLEFIAKMRGDLFKWREEFGVSDLSEESLMGIASTGKAYIHDFPDVCGRPVLIVVASKHFPAKQDPLENEKLCVFLIEKALSNLPPGKDKILGIFDLQGFSTENGDVGFLKFLIDVFYTYYPRRLGEVLFVDAPFIFQPIWQLVKPLLKSYASLVRFCSAETVRKEYFTDETVPDAFKE